MLFYLILIVIAAANLGLGYAVAHHLGYARSTEPKYYVEPTSQDAPAESAPPNVDP